MEILVKRTIPSKNSTIGSMFVNGKFQCYTLEPVDRGLTSDMTLAQIQAIKVDGETAQPTGTYSMDWYFSPDHGIYLPRILNIPGFQDDEIHIGNFPKDTKGCTLLGTGYGVDAVYNSKVAVGVFYPLFEAAFKNKEKITITYERTYVVKTND